jgi:hypothetical protein
MCNGRKEAARPKHKTEQDDKGRGGEKNCICIVANKLVLTPVPMVSKLFTAGE